MNGFKIVNFKTWSSCPKIFSSLEEAKKVQSESYKDYSIFKFHFNEEKNISFHKKVKITD